MKKMILMILVAATLVFGQADTGKKKQASLAKVLTRGEVDALLSNPGQVLIVDVRRPDEVSSVGGFPFYFSVQIAELEKALPFIPKDRTIIALSNHAGRAGRAADILTKAGFKVAGAAGAEDYESQGGTLLKIAVPPPNANAKKQ